MRRPIIVTLIDRTGFTLIEFSIAVFIMMVGLLGLLQSVIFATENNLGTLLRNEAISLADEQMVATKILAFSNVAPMTNYINRKTRGGFRNYSVVRTMQPSRTVTDPVTGAAVVAANEVTVRVSWRHKGIKQNHSVSTLISNPAL